MLTAVWAFKYRQFSLPPFMADVLLLGVAAIWGASYPVVKDLLLVVPVLYLLVLRFSCSFIFLSCFTFAELKRLSVSDVKICLVLGLMLSAIFLSETFGVFYTTASNAAFIISLCIVFTPILEALVKRRWPSLAIMACAGVSLAGTGIMMLNGAAIEIRVGDWLILAAAVLRAVIVVSTKRLLHERSISSGAVTTVQAGVVALVCVLIYGLGLSSGLIKGPVLPPIDPGFWRGLVFLVLFCTLAAFFIQNWAIRKTNPSRVGFLMGTEPVFGAVFASLLLGESLSAAGIIGALLILIGTFFGIKYSQA